MSDKSGIVSRQSNPLDGAAFAAGPGPTLTLAPANDCTRFSLRIARKDLAKAIAAFGQDLPVNIGGMSSVAGRKALCLGPDEWLLLAPQDAGEEITAQFAKQCEGTLHSLVDVGHRTVAIDVSGPAAALALNAGCPLDLDAMRVGSCTRTVLDKAEIILIKLGKERYRLEVVRSFADYVWKFLSSAGHEFKTEPG